MGACIFEVMGWQRPIMSNLQGGCRKGSIFDNHPQNDHVYSNIHMYIRIHKFDILRGANFEYAVTSNLAATDLPKMGALVLVQNGEDVLTN